jgi:hypothetical protein
LALDTSDSYFFSEKMTFYKFKKEKSPMKPTIYFIKVHKIMFKYIVVWATQKIQI